MTAHITVWEPTGISSYAYPADTKSFTAWCESWRKIGFTIEYTIPAYGPCWQDAIIHNSDRNMTVYVSLEN